MASTIKADYEALKFYREPYLERARNNAKLTIPALIPPDEPRRSGTKLSQPDNSIGPRGVNNLASKLLIGMMPSNAPVFRLMINDMQVKAELAARSGKKGTTDVQKALAQIERSGMQEIDATGIRGPAFVMFQHLIVAGNVVLYVDPDTGAGRLYPLHSFVCVRDRMGNVVKIIIQEWTAYGALDPALKAAADDAVAAQVASAETDELRQEKKAETEVDVYTKIARHPDGRFFVTVEVGGKEVEGYGGTYAADKCPWLAVRMIQIDGDDYGRSFIDDLYGDLFNVNELRGAITTWSRAASKVIYLVKPNATTKIDKLLKAKSGDFVQGNPEDIVALQIEKTQDFQVANSVLADVTHSLELAFLLNTSVQRDAERVTAEEVRQVIGELNTGLGGIQATLTNEFQLPFVNLTLSRMQSKKLFKLPKGIVRPAIVTGIAALGRGQELNNLLAALNALGTLNAIPPEFRERVKPTDFLERVFAAAGCDSEGLFMDDEEYAAFQQQKMLQQMAMQSAPGVAQEATKGIVAANMPQEGEGAPSEEAAA